MDIDIALGHAAYSIVLEHFVSKTINTGLEVDLRTASAFLVDKTTWKVFDEALKANESVKTRILEDRARIARIKKAEEIVKGTKHMLPEEFELLFKGKDPVLSGMGRDWYATHLASQTTDLKYALLWEGLLTLDEEPGINREWYTSRWYWTEHRNLFLQIEDARATKRRRIS